MEQVIRKKLLFVCILIIIAMLGSTSFAATETDLQNQQSDISSQIANTKANIGEINSQLSGALAEIQKINANITSYQGQLDGLNNQISDIQVSIDDTNTKLTAAEAEYDKQQQLLQDRLVALYENGNTTYLDVLVNSDSLVDFISNYYLVSEVASYDSDLLNQMQQSKDQIQQDKDLLETSKSQLETKKENIQATQTALKNSQNTKQQYAAQLTANQQQQYAQLEQEQKDQAEINAQLAAIAKQAKANGTITYATGTPSSHGFIFPVAGCNLNDITDKNYPSYPGHTGVDVNSSRVIGKSIVAVKDGTVVTSTALKNSDGTYRSYGEYIIIDHHDGTMTLYAHGAAGSRRAQAGDEVKQGEVIMTVGSTGNTTGPHLHFEVRVYSSNTGTYEPVNPIPYLQ